MVFYKGKEVKTKRFLTTINKLGRLNEVEVIDFKYLKELLGIGETVGFDLNMFNKCFDLITIFDYKLTKCITDINEIGDNFCLDRYEKFLNYKKLNKFSVDEEYYKLKFGEADGLIKYKEKINKTHNLSPYKKEYWVNKGYASDSEINAKINEYKKSKATSLEGFIKRHGEIEGAKKFEEFKTTSKHTLEKYIDLYGLEEGNEKWLNYLEIKKETSIFVKNYWVNKGFSEDEAEKMRKKFHYENLNTATVEFWINKGLTEEEAKNKVDEIYNKKGVKFRSASKASLKIFNPVMSYFKDSCLEFKIGIKDNKEHTIYNRNSKKLYYYDFTVPSLNLIFEYHGEKYHPHYSLKTNEELLNWVTINVNKYAGGEIGKKFNGVQVRENDILKEQLAIDNGFKYHVIWSSDNINESIIKIINIIKDENKKNNKE
jgi:hypothetical protein